MRNKWIKRLLPLIVLLLLTSWSVTYVYADNDNITSQDTARIETTAASVATNTASVDTITAPEEVLPSHVYVLNNREIVTEETRREMKWNNSDYQFDSNDRNSRSSFKEHNIIVHLSPN